MDQILGIHGLLDLPATVISEWLSWWMDHGVSGWKLVTTRNIRQHLQFRILLCLLISVEYRSVRYPVFLVHCVCICFSAICVMHCRCKMICYNYFHHKSWKQKIINCAQLSKQITAPVVIAPPHHGSHGGSHHTLSEIMDPPIFPPPGVPPRLSRVRNQFSLICTQPAPAEPLLLSKTIEVSILPKCFFQVLDSIES